MIWASVKRLFFIGISSSILPRKFYFRIPLTTGWITLGRALLVVGRRFGNVVDAGIKPQSTLPDRQVRERLQVLWLRWTDHADPGGLADFYGLQAMAVRAMIEGGESFARLRLVPDATAVPLHIDLLDRGQVPLDLHRDIGGGARIRAGIEFNGAGQRTAYWVMRDRPGDPLTLLRLDPLRIPATDCLHLFKPLAAGQLRGITWLAPVLLRLHELDQFEDAALVKAKVAALFTGFITDPNGSAGGLTGTNTNGALTVGMEPGSLIPLPPGTDKGRDHQQVSAGVSASLTFSRRPQALFCKPRP